MTVALEEGIVVKQSLPEKRPRRRQWASWPAFAVCVVVASIILIPLFAVVLGGVRTNGELLTAPFSIPKALHWENFQTVLAPDSPFWASLVNSVLNLIGTLVVLLVTACPAAFALARIRSRARGDL